MLNINDSEILKKKALEKFFERLNKEQQRAVFQINGPVLILAGAGSGKTTVLVNRIANMVYFGNAYHGKTPDFTTEEKDFLKSYIEGNVTDKKSLREILKSETVNPWNILAITFTNKAASELKERIFAMLGDEAAVGSTVGRRTASTKRSLTTFSERACPLNATSFPTIRR